VPAHMWQSSSARDRSAARIRDLCVGCERLCGILGDNDDRRREADRASRSPRSAASAVGGSERLAALRGETMSPTLLASFTGSIDVDDQQTKESELSRLFFGCSLCHSRKNVGGQAAVGTKRRVKHSTIPGLVAVVCLEGCVARAQRCRSTVSVLNLLLHPSPGCPSNSLAASFGVFLDVGADP